MLCARTTPQASTMGFMHVMGKIHFNKVPHVIFGSILFVWGLLMSVWFLSQSHLPQLVLYNTCMPPSGYIPSIDSTFPLPNKGVAWFLLNKHN